MVFVNHLKNMFKDSQTVSFLVNAFLKKYHYFPYYYVFKCFNKTKKLRRYHILF